MDRRHLIWGGGALALGAGAAVWSATQLWRRQAAGPLGGRLGDSVASFDRRYAHLGVGAATPTPGGSYRRVYDVGHVRIVADVTPDGLVRQLTVSRPRDVADTFEPAPGDWTLAQARAVAQGWLPADSRLTGSAPFTFQEREIGMRETYSSRALAARTSGNGQCAASYYQTRTGTVAFVLVGML